MEKQRAFIFIILGLVFSQFLLLKFNLWDGLEIHSLKIRVGSILQLHFNNSEYKELTTQFIGYILFTIFLLKNIKNKDARSSKLFEPTLIISILATIFEIRNIVLDIMNEYSGQHLTIGIILFALCMIIFNSAYDERVNSK